MLGTVIIVAVIVVAIAAVLAIVLGAMGIGDNPASAGTSILLGTVALAAVAVYIAQRIALEQAMSNFL